MNGLYCNWKKYYGPTHTHLNKKCQVSFFRHHKNEVLLVINDIESDERLLVMITEEEWNTMEIIKLTDKDNN